MGSSKGNCLFHSLSDQVRVFLFIFFLYSVVFSLISHEHFDANYIFFGRGDVESEYFWTFVVVAEMVMHRGTRSDMLTTATAFWPRKLTSRTPCPSCPAYASSHLPRLITSPFLTPRKHRPPRTLGLFQSLHPRRPCPTSPPAQSGRKPPGCRDTHRRRDQVKLAR